MTIQISDNHPYARIVKDREASTFQSAKESCFIIGFRAGLSTENDSFGALVWDCDYRVNPSIRDALSSGFNLARFIRSQGYKEAKSLEKITATKCIRLEWK